MIDPKARLRFNWSFGLVWAAISAPFGFTVSWLTCLVVSAQEVTAPSWTAAVAGGFINGAMAGWLFPSMGLNKRSLPPAGWLAVLVLALVAGYGLGSIGGAGGFVVGALLGLPAAYVICALSYKWYFAGF